MKYHEALAIIKRKPKGFMVGFDHLKNGMLNGDHFPDKHGGEKLIETEKEAWDLACQFAAATVGECVNIRVIDHTFKPLKTGLCQKIDNR